MKTIHRLSISPATPRTIGRLLLAGAICWSGAPLFAQNQPPAPVPQSQPGSRALLSQEDLKEMVGPIALYPDALIALILPASTVPSDVVLGARFVDSKGDASQAGNQPWDESVKSLVYYPDVLSWMNENLEWTASLGEAFMDQPADVMNAIQGLRATAQASGALTDTPQQRVVVQQETIRIIPADPEVIYVPQYDPQVVFVDSYSPGYTPFITFGVGFAVGSWLNYDCDWGRRYVYRGDWNRNGWDRGRGDVFINNTNVNVNVVNINSNNAVRWNPSNRSVRQLEQRQRNGGGNARFTTAEARAAREMIRTERRQNNGRLSANALAAARRDALPTPAKLQLREAANNRGAVRPQDRTNRNDTAEALAEARRNRENATPNRPVAENRRKTPTEAPRVNGQLEAARQARREENRQNAAEDRQNVRQQLENRQVERPNQLPTRAPRVEDSMPSQRPSVSERQQENRQSIQDNRQERQEVRQQRQEQRQERPQRQEVRQPQPQRQEARQERQQQRPQQRQEQRSERPQQQRERAERPQQQQRQEARQQRQEQRPQRQEARQQQRQENRSADRPQRQEQRSEKRSEDKGDRKKKD